MSEKLVRSKNALPYPGSVYVKISFRIVEAPRKNHYISSGRSKFYNNIRSSKRTALNWAIIDAERKRFPQRTVTAYDITIISYYFEYLMYNYEIIEKDNKYYEKFRDKRNKRTKYYVINDKHIIAPDESVSGIKWEDKKQNVKK
jgi:hypothetical protein